MNQVNMPRAIAALPKKGINRLISFNESKIPTFLYSHRGAIVLHGENSTAISRLI